MSLIDPKDKEWIDRASYEDLLRRWRHAPVGEQIFCGVSGAYYQTVMAERRKALTPGEQVEASKSVGWGR